MRRALEGLDGVKKADVSFSREEAVVFFEEGRANIDEMVRVVDRLGFRASEKRAQ